jgi:hypothetical protein
VCTLRAVPGPQPHHGETGAVVKTFLPPQPDQTEKGRVAFVWGGRYTLPEMVEAIEEQDVPRVTELLQRGHGWRWRRWNRPGRHGCTLTHPAPARSPARLHPCQPPRTPLPIARPGATWAVWRGVARSLPETTGAIAPASPATGRGGDGGHLRRGHEVGGILHPSSGSDRRSWGILRAHFLP